METIAIIFVCFSAGMLFGRWLEGKAQYYGSLEWLADGTQELFPHAQTICVKHEIYRAPDGKSENFTIVNPAWTDDAKTHRYAQASTVSRALARAVQLFKKGAVNAQV